MNVRTSLIGGSEVEIAKPGIDVAKELAELEALAAGEGIDLGDKNEPEEEREEEVVETKKKCSKCGEMKELSEFSKNKAAPDGLEYWCRACKAKGAKARWAKDHPARKGPRRKEKIPEPEREIQEEPKPDPRREPKPEPTGGALDRFVAAMKKELVTDMIKGLMERYEIGTEELA